MSIRSYKIKLILINFFITVFVVVFLLGSLIITLICVICILKDISQIFIVEAHTSIRVNPKLFRLMIGLEPLLQRVYYPGEINIEDGFAHGVRNHNVHVSGVFADGYQKGQAGGGGSVSPSILYDSNIHKVKDMICIREKGALVDIQVFLECYREYERIASLKDLTEMFDESLRFLEALKTRELDFFYFRRHLNILIEGFREAFNEAIEAQLDMKPKAQAIELQLDINPEPEGLYTGAEAEPEGLYTGAEAEPEGLYTGAEADVDAEKEKALEAQINELLADRRKQAAEVKIFKKIAITSAALSITLLGIGGVFIALGGGDPSTSIEAARIILNTKMSKNPFE